MYIIFRTNPVDEPFIFDCVDRHWEQTDAFRENGLPFYNYLQTEKGQGIVEVCGKKILLRENEGIMIAPFIEHSYRKLDENWYTCFITITGTIESSIPKIIGNHPYILYGAEKGKQTALLIDRCIENYNKHSPADMRQTSLDCYNILLHLSSENSDQNINNDPLFCQYVKPVLNEIESSFAHDISVEELSKIVFITPQYLSRLFQRYLSCTTSDYIIKFRISKAKELLISMPKMSIQEVAYHSGFNDVSHFIAIFKKRTGYTPLEFRKNN